MRNLSEQIVIEIFEIFDVFREYFVRHKPFGIIGAPIENAFLLKYVNLYLILVDTRTGR